MGAFSKSTSTAKAGWKKDCDAFTKAGITFKIKGIRTDEHRRFVLNFAARHHLSLAHGEETVYLAPPEATD